MECTELRHDLMEVLYGEASPETRNRLDAHLAACPACREDMASFRRVRGQLAAWTLPEAEPRRGAPSRLWRGAAAAAVLLLAAGGALRLSGAELQYQGGPLRIQLGRAGLTEALLTQEEARLEARHRQEIEALKASVAGSAPRDDEAIIARVRTLLRESEARHAALLQASLDDLSQRAEARRRYDLARVSAGLSYLDGKTGQDMARTTELVSYVLKASEKR